MFPVVKTALLPRFTSFKPTPPATQTKGESGDKACAIPVEQRIILWNTCTREGAIRTINRIPLANQCSQQPTSAQSTPVNPAKWGCSHDLPTFESSDNSHRLPRSYHVQTCLSTCGGIAPLLSSSFRRYALSWP